MIANVALALGLRRFVDRLEQDDPRQQLIARALLYGGTFVVIAMSVRLRHRG